MIDRLEFRYQGVVTSPGLRRGRSGPVSGSRAISDGALARAAAPSSGLRPPSPALGRRDMHLSPRPRPGEVARVPRAGDERVRGGKKGAFDVPSTLWRNEAVRGNSTGPSNIRAKAPRASCGQLHCRPRLMSYAAGMPSLILRKAGHPTNDTTLFWEKTFDYDYRQFFSS